MSGVSASPGIAIGNAYVVQHEGVIIPEYLVPEERVLSEVERLRAGIAMSRAQLERIQGGVDDVDIVAAILRTQLMILEDRSLFEDAARRVRDQRMNAEWALREVLRRLDGLFAAMEDPYLRERRADVLHIGRRLQLNLLGREPESFENIQGPAVVVAHDLSPAETAQMDRSLVVGLVTEAGGRTSHTAIMANSLGLPAVVGVGAATQRVRDGDTVIVEGSAGRVLVRPDAPTRRAYRARAEGYALRERELLRLADLPAETRDGRRVELMGNIERSDEIPRLRSFGARGVGLFRTEYLYMNRAEPPDEEEQCAHYRAVLEAVRPDPAVIRTLDLGGDKLPSGLQTSDEANPALGMRGIRLSLTNQPLLRAQLRAMLRASVHGRLRILLPMVSGVAEVRLARERLLEAHGELEREGRPVAEDFEVGLMIETPAAVTLADLLAREVDFLSIGTNDLIQYTLAVDRSNERVAYLYSSLHPAVLRAIAAVVASAQRAGGAVAVCGEMAGDPLNSLVLLGLGVDELSMNAPAVPQVKRILRASTFAEARALCAELLELSTAAEVADRVHKEMLRRFPDQFEARLEPFD